jgi:hypothetical protein
MLRLLKIIDLRPLEADSSLTGLSLSRGEYALHFVRVYHPLPKQASAAAAADSSDSPMLLHQPQHRDCDRGHTTSS